MAGAFDPGRESGRGDTVTSERDGLSVEAVADSHSSGLLPERAVLGSTTDRLSGRSRPGGGTVQAIRGQRWQPAADAAPSSMGTRRGAPLRRVQAGTKRVSASAVLSRAPLLVPVAVPMDGRKRRGAVNRGSDPNSAGSHRPACHCSKAEAGIKPGRRFLPSVAVPLSAIGLAGFYRQEGLASPEGLSCNGMTKVAPAGCSLQGFWPAGAVFDHREG